MHALRDCSSNDAVSHAFSSSMVFSFVLYRAGAIFAVFLVLYFFFNVVLDFFSMSRCATPAFGLSWRVPATIAAST